MLTLPNLLTCESEGCGETITMPSELLPDGSVTEMNRWGPSMGRRAALDRARWKGLVPEALEVAVVAAAIKASLGCGGQPFFVHASS